MYAALLANRIAGLVTSGWPIPLGVWPLNARHGAADISGQAVGTTFHDITYATGPNGILERVNLISYFIQRELKQIYRLCEKLSAAVGFLAATDT